MKSSVLLVAFHVGVESLHGPLLEITMSPLIPETPNESRPFENAVNIYNWFGLAAATEVSSSHSLELLEVSATGVGVPSKVTTDVLPSRARVSFVLSPTTIVTAGDNSPKRNTTLIPMLASRVPTLFVAASLMRPTFLSTLLSIPAGSMLNMSESVKSLAGRAETYTPSCSRVVIGKPLYDQRPVYDTAEKVLYVLVVGKESASFIAVPVGTHTPTFSTPRSTKVTLVMQ